MRLKKHLPAEPSVFDGSQLQPEWADGRFGPGMEGISAFIGPFRPAASADICSPNGEIFEDRRLLHLVVRHVHQDVEKIRLQQRLLLDVAKDKMNHRLPVTFRREGSEPGDVVQRWGHDLRRGPQHLSVSVIRMTASGAIIYLGISRPETETEPSSETENGGGLDLSELARAIVDQYVFEIDRARQPIS
jgi:hypothetical protein